MRAWTSWLSAGALSVVAVGAAYEVAVAAGVLDVGPLPGDEPPGRQAVFAATELALLAATVGDAATMATAMSGPRSVGLRLLPLAAAAFLLARFFSFDAYYAPARRRMSDDGFVAPGLVLALAGGCAVASLLLWRRPRPTRRRLVPRAARSCGVQVRRSAGA